MGVKKRPTFVNLYETGGLYSDASNTFLVDDRNGFYLKAQKYVQKGILRDTIFTSAFSQ